MEIDPLLNIAMVVPRTEAEGPGTRFAIWVQGCPMRCKGCCNPEFLAFVPKTQMRASALIQQILSTAVEGISFLGGEPIEQAEGVAAVAKAVKARGLSVMVFTGYTLAQLQQRKDKSITDLLQTIDILVDGQYVPELRTTNRRWVGSTNQVMHFLTDRYKATDPQFHAPNHVEIHILNNRVVLNGWPTDGAKTKL